MNGLLSKNGRYRFKRGLGRRAQFRWRVTCNVQGLHGPVYVPRRTLQTSPDSVYSHSFTLNKLYEQREQRSVAQTAFSHEDEDGDQHRTTGEEHRPNTNVK